MIKFFRKIRFHLMSSGQTSKYFKYAIGEILLVVIGILIALQINNWNDKRKTKLTVDQVLKEVQEDLYNDIVELSLAIDWHNNQDSISSKIINGEYVKSDLINLNNEEILRVGLRYYDIIISDRSFKLLSEYKDRIPDSYRDLIKRLNSMYVEDQSYLNTTQKQLIDFTNEYVKFLYETKEWFLQNNNWPNEEALLYFTESNYHKRQLTYYSRTLRGLVQYAIRLRDKAVTNYMIIRYLLQDDSKLPKFITNYGMSGQSPEGQYEGVFVYPGEEETSLVRLNKKYDLVLWENIDDEFAFYFPEILLTEISKDTLAFAFDVRYEILIQRNDENQPVKLLTFFEGALDREYKLYEDKMVND